MQQTSRIRSKMVKLVRYDSSDLSLEVHLRSGRRWIYLGVPRDVIDEFLSAQSPGWYYAFNIRNTYARRGASRMQYLGRTMAVKASMVWSLWRVRRSPR